MAFGERERRNRTDPMDVDTRLGRSVKAEKTEDVPPPTPKSFPVRPRSTSKLPYRHPAQRHFAQINPAFSIAFHESERTDPERTRVRVGPPALTSDGFYLLGLVHRIRFYDGEMRHIRPRLLIVDRKSTRL